MTKQYMNEYNSWLNNEEILENMKSFPKSEIEDRFYKKLEFGTAGIRGILGAGTNRMNVHIVAEVAKAIAEKIICENKQNDGVVIGYDVRHMSKEFAELSAAIFTKKGIKTYLFENVTATPILSYAIREFKTANGIMITASHNPKEYNGYKVYGSNGIQILQEDVKKIKLFMSKLENPYSVKEYNFENIASEVNYVGEDFISKYLNEVSKLSINNIQSNLKTVYTPLNGTGSEFVRKTLIEQNSTQLFEVEEQMLPDPDFTTTGSPNPEDETAFTLAKEKGEEVSADLLIATDPDADRVGAMVLHEGSYHMITGNVLGTLLTNYILNQMDSKGVLPENPSIVKTIVTDNLVDKIAQEYNVKVHDVHVGFKNIYSLVEKWNLTKERNYILGYEESYGFGIGTNIARDKDAISATRLIVEMTSYYHNLGKTLVDVFDEIQSKYGYHAESLKSVVLEGKEGLSKMQEIVFNLRNNPIEEIAGSKLTKYTDYLQNTKLEKENVLKFMYEDGTWFVVRPSGTEPKLKIYIYVVAKDKKSVQEKLSKVSNEIISKVQKEKNNES